MKQVTNHIYEKIAIAVLNTSVERCQVYEDLIDYCFNVSVAKFPSAYGRIHTGKIHPLCMIGAQLRAPFKFLDTI